MDRTVTRGGLSRRSWLALAVVVLLLVGGVLAWPAYRQLASVDRAWTRRVCRLAPVADGQSGPGCLGRRSHRLGQCADAVCRHRRHRDAAGEGGRPGPTRARCWPRSTAPSCAASCTQEQSALESVDVALGRARIVARQSDTRNASAIELAEVRLQGAKRNLERARQTFDEGLLNKVDYERAQDDVQLAEVELKTARDAKGLERETAEFEIRTQHLARARQASLADEVARQVTQLSLVAPFDGLIGAINVQDRDAVAANQPVLTVVNLDAYEIEFSLPENEAAEAGPGTPVRVLYEGREYDGKVTAISPSVADSLVKGRAAFVGATPPTLRQNQRVSLRLLFETRRAS